MVRRCAIPRTLVQKIMKQISLLLAIGCLTSCSSIGPFKNQVAEHEPHAIIEIPSYVPKLASGEEVVVTGIDGKHLNRGAKSFRVRPGTHRISYRVTTPTRFSELSPQQQAAEVGLFPLLLITLNDDHKYVKVTQPTRQIEAEPGKRYSLEHQRVAESDISQPPR